MKCLIFFALAFTATVMVCADEEVAAVSNEKAKVEKRGIYGGYSGLGYQSAYDPSLSGAGYLGGGGYSGGIGGIGGGYGGAIGSGYTGGLASGLNGYANNYYSGAYPGAYSHNAYTSVNGLGYNGYPGSYNYNRRFGGGYNNGYNNGYNYNNGYSNGYNGIYNSGTTYPYGGIGYSAGGGYY